MAGSMKTPGVSNTAPTPVRRRARFQLCGMRSVKLNAGRNNSIAVKKVMNEAEVISPTRYCSQIKLIGSLIRIRIRIFAKLKIKMIRAAVKSLRLSYGTDPMDFIPTPENIMPLFHEIFYTVFASWGDRIVVCSYEAAFELTDFQKGRKQSSLLR